MTAAALAPSVEYLGNGVSLAFAAPFRFLAGTLVVDLIAADGTVTRQALGSAYSIAGGTTDAGGTVTFTAAPAGGVRVRIRRDTPRAQTTDYSVDGTFPAESHEAALDRAMLIDQEQDVKIGDTGGRALQVPDGETVVPVPAAAARADRLLAFDATAAAAPIATPFTLTQLASVIAYIYSGIFTQLADLVMYLAAGAGAIARSVQAKLRDGRVSVKDYGALGDGVTNDTAAIALAAAQLAAGKTLYFPAGNYVASASPTDSRAIPPLPVGANVYMEDNAWLLLDYTSGPLSGGLHSVDAFTPLGKNVLKINVDGQALAESDTVIGGTWRSTPVAIRAYSSADRGLGAADVTVRDSKFRNLSYVCQSVGAKRWRVHSCRAERTKNSAWLMENDTIGGVVYSAMHNVFTACHSEQTGDTSIAFHTASASPSSQAGFNVVDACTAKDWCLLTQGFAFDVESRSDGDFTKQHHNIFSNLAGEHTIAGLASGIGLAVMHSSEHSKIVSCSGQAAQGNASDCGIAIGSGSAYCSVEGCDLTGFRGQGINLNGSTYTSAVDNRLLDCGGDTYVNAPIVLGSGVPSQGNAARDNTIVVSPGYAFGGAGTGFGISCTGLDTEQLDLLIEGNQIFTPYGVGIILIGTAGLAIKRPTVRDNVIVATVAASVNASPPQPINIQYADQPAVHRNRLDDTRYGLSLTHCTSADVKETLFSGNPGVTAMLSLFDFSNSTGHVVRDTGYTKAAGVTTPVANAGTGGYFWHNAKILPSVFANDAGAAAGGVPLGAPYWNGTAVAVRMV